MKYPEFYKEVETITLSDSLSNLLGAFESGEIEFSYLDIVKSAGHSCPTVAGAYLSVVKALGFLYPEALPTRGGIKVEFRDSEASGVTGVIANVVENITGATVLRGFKGLGGNHARHSLMCFDAPIQGEIRFTRLDTGAAVETVYNPHSIEPHPQQMLLMQKIMQNWASEEEKAEFAKHWQNRVKAILVDNFSNPDILQLSEPKG